MSLLLTLVVSAAPLTPAGHIARVEPDSGSVALAIATDVPSLPPEDALTILLSEHRLSIPIYLIEEE
jgi:hypothetical protein